ncbi:MAG TPA: phosphoribosylformylglycinamidine synthase subunit PurQ, partial [candidate division Zixibacteria bacterium]|nr:phosphoribosylformylglycinamidine synthase subunit PurQ [candidate division Zixibacteria bacterium]
VYLRVEHTSSPYTRACLRGEVLRIPIAHGEGNYYHFDREIGRLEDRGQVVFRYCDREGNTTPAANPNGSRNNIAGIANEEGNVLGLMPHPERAVEPILGSSDGLRIFESIRATIGTTVRT